jgi:hypothetical protein
MTREGDLVLTHIKNKPAFFARIENIGTDIKPGWFQVKMLVLQVPLVTVTWILREAYINGDEFTMGGHPVKLVKVVVPEDNDEPAATASPESFETPVLESGQPADEQQAEASEARSKKQGKVFSLADRRRKNPD